MSKSRKFDEIYDELIEELELLKNNNRRDNRLEDDRFNNRCHHVDPNNDWCPGCSSNSFCNNFNDDEDDDRFDNCRNRCNHCNRQTQ